MNDIYYEDNYGNIGNIYCENGSGDCSEDDIYSEVYSEDDIYFLEGYAEGYSKGSSSLETSKIDKLSWLEYATHIGKSAFYGWLNGIAIATLSTPLWVYGIVDNDYNNVVCKNVLGMFYYIANFCAGYYAIVGAIYGEHGFYGKETYDLAKEKDLIK